jgi:hypothetical protein
MYAAEFDVSLVARLCLQRDSLGLKIRVSVVRFRPWAPEKSKTYAGRLATTRCRGNELGNTSRQAIFSLMTLLCRMMKGHRTGHCRRCPFTRSGDISKCEPSCAEPKPHHPAPTLLPAVPAKLFRRHLDRGRRGVQGTALANSAKRYRQRCWQSDHDVG